MAQLNLPEDPDDEHIVSDVGSEDEDWDEAAAAAADAALEAECAAWGAAGRGVGVGLDIEELCEELSGVSPQEAEREIRCALRRAHGRDSEARDEDIDADVLGVLLRLFRGRRDAALEGYEPWDAAIALCRPLTELCDRNFVGIPAAEDETKNRELPASIVATVYAECGRTFALAGSLQKARDRLEKALAVFGLIPDGGDLSTQLQVGAAQSSMGRVYRRLGHARGAQKHYVQALQISANFGSEIELSDLIGEFCELLSESELPQKSPESGEEGSACGSSTESGVLGRSGGVGAFPEALPAVLCELAQEKFGEGSDMHLKALKDVADACIAAHRRHLAARALATRATWLRRRCRIGSGSGGGGKGASRHSGAPGVPGSMLRAEAEAAEEEAALALEESVPGRLAEGDLEGAFSAWAEALELRESSEGTDSPIVAEMRTSLAALRAAIIARYGTPSLAEGSGTGVGDVHEVDGIDEIKIVPERWDEEDEDDEAAAGTKKDDVDDGGPQEIDARIKISPEESSVPSKPKPSLLSETPAELRPSWGLGRGRGGRGSSLMGRGVGRGLVSYTPSGESADASRDDAWNS